MFSCIQGVVDHTSLSHPQQQQVPTSTTRQTQQPQQHDQATNLTPIEELPADREIFDQIIEEGIKLKKKCKSLRFLLLEAEHKRADEMVDHEKKILELTTSYDNKVNELKAQHFIELQQCRDHCIQDFHEITTAYQDLQLQYHILQSNLEEMEKQIYRLENEKTQIKQENNRHWESLLLKLREEMQAYQDQHQQEKESLTNQLSAQGSLVGKLENENAKLTATQAELQSQLEARDCSTCSQLRNDVRILSQAKDELLIKSNQLQDENSYYKEENQRLEKQVSLIKQDLEKVRNSMDYRHMLKTEKEQRLHQELMVAKEAIQELQLSLRNVLETKDAVTNSAQLVAEQNQLLRQENEELRAALVVQGNSNDSANPLLPTSYSSSAWDGKGNK